MNLVKWGENDGVKVKVGFSEPPKINTKIVVEIYFYFFFEGLNVVFLRMSDIYFCTVNTNLSNNNFTVYDSIVLNKQCKGYGCMQIPYSSSCRKSS